VTVVSQWCYHGVTMFLPFAVFYYAFSFLAPYVKRLNKGKGVL
jgi:hypothetical protein